MANIDVANGGDFQAAIDSAVGGDVIRLGAGASIFTGNFRLKAKGNSSPITIRTNVADGSLPAAGARVNLTYQGTLARIQSNVANTPAISADSGAKNYILLGLEFLPNPNGMGEIIRLGDNDYVAGVGDFQLRSSIPDAITVDRCILRGDAFKGQKRGIFGNCTNLVVKNSHIDRCFLAGQDANAIAVCNSYGPITILNNYLEASAYAWILGGADPVAYTDAQFAAGATTTGGTLQSFRLGPNSVQHTISSQGELIGQRISLTYGGTANVHHAIVTSRSGNVITFDPPCPAPPDTGSASIVRWGANPANVTIRRNYVFKPTAWRDSALLGTPANVSTSATAGSLSAGTYFYRVQAIAVGSFSSVTQYTSDAAAQVSRTLASTGGITISWDAVTNATKYRVWGRANNAPDRYFETASTSFTDTGGSGTTTYPNTVLANNPVSYLRFEETSGTVADDQASATNGTYNGSPTLNQTGMIANSVCPFFDGVDDYVSVPTRANLDIGTNLSMECWFNATSYPVSFPRLICKGSVSTTGYQMLVDANAAGGPKLSIQLQGLSQQSFASTGTVPVGTTFHAVATYDGSNVRIYLNGALDSTHAATGTITAVADPLQFGRRGDGTAYWHGYIDEPVVYNSVLSGTDVSNRYALRSDSGTLATFNATGTRPVVKNTWELKSGVNVQIDSNLMENHWRGTDGYAIWVKSVNQEGKGTFTETRNVVIEKNWWKNIVGCVLLSGQEKTGGNVNKPVRMGATTLRNNVFENSIAGSVRTMSIADSPTPLVIDHNTILHSGATTDISSISFHGQIDANVTITNNIGFRRFDYGINVADPGTGNTQPEGSTSFAFMATQGGSMDMRKNVLVDMPSNLYPADNFFATEVQFQAGFTNYNGGSGGDYSIANAHAWNNAGTDLLDIGADIAAVTTAISGVTTGTAEGSDTTDPVSSITLPVNEATVSGDVLIVASATDNVGVSRVELWIDGVEEQTSTNAPYTFIWDSTEVSDGIHTLQTRAFDPADNEGQSSIITVNVLNTPASPGSRLYRVRFEVPPRKRQFTVGGER